MKYFDYAATCPLETDAADVYLKAATGFYGNANSLHDIGGLALSLLENSRESLAHLLGVDKKGLFFTSGGSESNFLALEALLSSRKKTGRHIISSIAEHSSIQGSLKRLEKVGYNVTYLPFNADGRIPIDELIQSTKPDTILIAIQHINSEIGTLQPIDSILKICEEKDIFFHSDYVQSFGKVDMRHINARLSSFSFSGHKIYGPKGTGGLYIDPRLHWIPFFPGGTHEKGLRPGTVNVPGIAAMTAAAQKAVSQIEDNMKKYWDFRSILINTLQPIRSWLHIHEAEKAWQYPGIIGLRIEGVEGQWLMLELNRLGFAVSTGSACQTGMQSPSNTMNALGLSSKEAKEFFRISFGYFTTYEEVISLGDCLVNLVLTLKQ